MQSCLIITLVPTLFPTEMVRNRVWERVVYILVTAFSQGLSVTQKARRYPCSTSLFFAQFFSYQGNNVKNKHSVAADMFLM